MPSVLTKLGDYELGSRSLGAALLIPVLFCAIPGFNGVISPSRSLALALLQASDFLAAKSGLVPDVDPTWASRVLDHVPAGRVLGGTLASLALYRLASKAWPMQLFLRNALPAKCVLGIIACGLEAGMPLRRTRGSSSTTPTTPLLVTRGGRLSDPTISLTVRATSRALLRMHRAHMDLSRARRKQMKVHAARVAATLYDAELKIDVTPAEGRRHLAMMLTTIAENFAAGQLSALYPESELVTTRARDWDRLKSISCASAGLLLLWWTSSWDLAEPTQIAVSAVAFVAPFVAVYGSERAVRAISVWRPGP